jgi:hypothetical protein
MTFKYAIGVLVSASDVRMAQWEGLSKGADPGDLINELYEADKTEAAEMAALIKEAIRVVKKIYG